MKEEPASDKVFAIKCFNLARVLIEKEDRYQEDNDLAFASESMARACKHAGDDVETAKHITLAKEAGGKITDKDDRAYFFSELETIQPGS